MDGELLTCVEHAQKRLADRAIKESTYREYLATLSTLGLSELPLQSVTVAMVNTRLQRVLHPGTRRKHAINLRATLGLNIPCPRPVSKTYALPGPGVLHEALANSSYAMYGFSMLYAGLRIGESLVKQPQQGNVLLVDRQRLPDGSIASAKTTGPIYVPDWFSEAYKAFEPSHRHNTVYVGIKRAFRKVKLGHLTPHSLRHAFATNLVNAGAAPEVLRRQMRHHDVAVSLRYYVQTTDDDIIRVVEAMGAIERPFLL